MKLLLLIWDIILHCKWMQRYECNRHLSILNGMQWCLNITLFYSKKGGTWVCVVHPHSINYHRCKHNTAVSQMFRIIIKVVIMHYIPNKTYTITHNNTYNYLNIIIIMHLDNNLIQRVKELRVSSVEKNVTLFKVQGALNLSMDLKLIFIQTINV